MVKCKKHQAATKKLEIYKAPDILVICIKRFGSSRRLSDKVSRAVVLGTRADKQLDNLVNFPVEGLDLEERVGERRIAKSLDLSDEECRKYDIEPSSEPLVYDLCESPSRVYD
jgi:ubiquitin carboxyl-terminal hydrolase 4/11/15